MIFTRKLDKKYIDQDMIGALVAIQEVMKLGADKYGLNSYKDPDNPSMQHKANGASMFRHLSQHQVDSNAIDEESDQFHIAHLACRALMKIVRLNKGIDINEHI